jgi:hypothetical protein
VGSQQARQQVQVEAPLVVVPDKKVKRPGEQGRASDLLDESSADGDEVWACRLHD